MKRRSLLKALSIAGITLSPRISSANTLRKPVNCAVIGIGGLGCKITASLESMPEFGSVIFTYVDTDAKLMTSESQSHAFDSVLTDSISCRKSAIESIHKLEQSIRDVGLVFAITGLGGRTGSAAAPVIAKLAKETGKTCLVLAVTPFAFEGVRCTAANQSLEELREHASQVLAFSNETALGALDKDATLADASNHIHHRVLDTARQLLQAESAIQIMIIHTVAM